VAIEMPPMPPILPEQPIRAPLADVAPFAMSDVDWGLARTRRLRMGNLPQMVFLFDLLAVPILGQAVWLWCSFFAIVLALLALDLGVLHRGDKPIGFKESLWMSGFYVGIAFLFGAWVWWRLGDEAGLNFLTGYLIEYSLSLDNVFVISMIFAYFAVPERYQHRVLFWGILGAIVMRGVMIALGAALVSTFSWVLYVFGAFLLATGIKMLFGSSTPKDLSENVLLRWLRRRLPVTDEFHGQRFLVRKTEPVSGERRLYATPLLLALILVEAGDLVFAVDSVPAVFSITTDIFIVYTSNIFAVLGLRTLYFTLAAMVRRFQYLKYSLALILVFVGVKIYANHIIGKIPPGISLFVVVCLIVGGVVFSLLKTRRPDASSGRAT
jgi:tellurite resistance protein TerC